MIEDLLKSNDKKNKFFKYYEYEYKKYYPDLGIPESKEKAENAFKLIKKLRLNATSIIDIGCGPGMFLREIIKKTNTKKAVGTDISMFILNIAQKNNPEVNFYRTNNKKLPFENEEFEISCFIDVIEHIPNPEKVISEAKRISKYLLVKIPLEECLFFKIINFIKKIDWKKTKGHVNIYSFETFNYFMKKNRLKLKGYHIPKNDILDRMRVKGSLKYRIFEIFQIPFLSLPFFIRRKIIITEIYAIYQKV